MEITYTRPELFTVALQSLRKLSINSSAPTPEAGVPKLAPLSIELYDEAAKAYQSAIDAWSQAKLQERPATEVAKLWEEVEELRKAMLDARAGEVLATKFLGVFESNLEAQAWTEHQLIFVKHYSETLQEEL